MPRRSLAFPPLRLRVAVFPILFAVVLSAPVVSTWAQSTTGDVDSKLKAIERELKESESKTKTLDRRAGTLARELKQLSQAKIAAARKIQEMEARLSTLEAEIADLNAAEREKQRLLKSRRAQFSDILSAVHRLALYPPEALITQPIPPGDLVRTAVLLRSTVPQVEGQASRLRDDLLALNETRNHILESRKRLSDAQRVLDEQRQKLAALHDKKRQQRSQTLAERRREQQRLKELTGEASNLRELFTKLAEEEQVRARAEEEAKKARELSKKANVRPSVKLEEPFTYRDIAKAKGKLPFPVVGRIVSRYGEAQTKGVSRKGVTIETRGNAQVVAPFDGKVVFAGVFRGYGQLLIIEHGEGYHTLLAGMDRIDGVPGQWLLAGEPVGEMGRSTNDKPRLYVEFRRKGQPINPLPWLVAQK